MSIENRRTIEIYKEKAEIYLNNNLEHDRLDITKAKHKRKNLENLIKTSFESLPQNAKVFEIGSGDGVNAKFIENLGFRITASDIAEAFIEATQNQGVKTIKFNVLEDEFPEKYFAVFCWRVFVHFTKEDALKTIKKVYNVLEDGGIFIFNVINREFREVDNEWIDFEGEYHMGAERYYNYFKKEELDNLIKQTNFKIENFHTEGGDNNNKWLVYVLKK